MPTRRFLAASAAVVNIAMAVVAVAPTSATAASSHHAGARSHRAVHQHRPCREHRHPARCHRRRHHERVQRRAARQQNRSDSVRPGITTPVSVSLPSGDAWASGVWPGGNSLNANAVDRFGAYRGAPVNVATVYQIRDSWDSLANNMWAVDQYQGWPGTLSISLPLVPDGHADDLAGVADGQFDSQFMTFAQNLVDRGRGDSIIRLAWEFNIPDYAWSATNATVWVAAFRRVVTDLRSVAPDLQIDWCGNYGIDQTGYSSFKDLYPGNHYVDIIGVDAYNNQWNPVNTPAQWREFVDGTGGLAAWLDFASAHGKKLSVPEWGLFSDGGGDNPFYITMMHTFFAEHADDIAYECYFNESQSYIRASLEGPTQNPRAAATYAALWGTSS